MARTTFSSNAQLRVNDPVITQLLHGYANGEIVAPFLAPAVNVQTRAGKVIRFGKEQFAVMDLGRAPGNNISRLSSGFDTDAFYVEQHAVGAEVPEEVYQEAINGEARIDLRANAALRAADAIAQHWEAQVIDTVTDNASFEASCQTALTGTDRWDDPDSDPEAAIAEWNEQIRDQVGVYANSLLVDPHTYRALKLHPKFQDRIKYTSQGSINQEMLSSWFDLGRGMRIATRKKLGAQGQLEDMLPRGTALLFYSPEGDMGQGLTPMAYSDAAKPAFAYTYTLAGYPTGGQERFDEDRRVYVTDVIAEQSIQLVGLGQNGLCGSAFLASDVVS